MANSRKRRVFYGWILVAFGHLLMAVVGGSVYYGFGVFFKPMAADLGWARGVTATGFSKMILVMGGSAPLMAAVIKRIGLRIVLGAGSILLVASILLMSLITQPWQLYLVYGIVIGMVMSATTFLALTTMVNYWFIKRRALAAGIVLAGSGSGTLVLAPLSRYLISVIGWRNSWVILAIIVFFLATIPAVILVRNRPEDIGEKPDGENSPVSITGKTASQRAVTPRAVRNWEVKAALKTPALWLVAAAMCTSFFTVNMMTVHQVTHLIDIGISEVAAAGALGSMVGFSALARIIGGILGDRFKLSYLAATACLMEVIGLLILLNARALWLIYFYLLIFGAAYGLLSVIPPAMIGAYYGRNNYAPIFSFVFLAATLSGAIGPVLAGFIFDTRGSYLIAFIVATVLCSAGAVCSLLARPPEYPAGGT